MTISLETLAKKLEREVGLVANVVSINNETKIVGGTEYDQRGEIGLYVKKYEVALSKPGYCLKLPVGQTFIEAYCESDEEAIDTLVSHFRKYYPNSAIDRKVLTGTAS